MAYDSLHRNMNANETIILAGPRGEYFEAVIKSLQQASISARLVAIDSVDPYDRPTWACTPGDEEYVVVPEECQSAALDVVRRVWRICLTCETILLSEARSCQKCGTPDERQPGPDPNWGKGYVSASL
jgi:hypothetical protein